MYLTEKDRKISAWLNISEKTGLWHTIIQIISYSGNGVFFSILIIIILFWGPPNWNQRAFVFLIANIITWAITQIIKRLIHRPRPEAKRESINHRNSPYSFPSGHATRGGMASSLALMIGPFFFGLTFTIWGLLIAASRIMVGEHYFLDSVAGFIIGLLVGFIIGIIFPLQLVLT